MSNISDDWRDFIRHAGIYIIIIGALATIGGAWVGWPALIWGAAVAIHLLTVLTERLRHDPIKDFLRHAGVYVIVIGALSLLSLPVAWPAFIWGAAVAIHLLVALTEQRKDRSKQRDEAAAVERDNRLDQNDLQYDQTTLSLESFQTQLEKAFAYRDRINEMVRTAPNEKRGARLQDVAAQVNDWVDAIANLAQRLDAFEQDALIHQDLETVPEAIASLEDQLASEQDATLQTALRRTLANRKNQLAALKQLQQLMKRSEIQMEDTLSSLGTIYSQLLTDQSTHQVADYSRLSSAAEEETRLLQDRLDALAEIKLGHN